MRKSEDEGVGLRIVVMEAGVRACQHMSALCIFAIPLDSTIICLDINCFNNDKCQTQFRPSRSVVGVSKSVAWYEPHLDPKIVSPGL